MEKQIIMSVSEYKEMLEAYNNIKDGKIYRCCINSTFYNQTFWSTDSEMCKELADKNNMLFKQNEEKIIESKKYYDIIIRLENLTILQFIRYKLSSQYRNKINNCN